MKTFSNKSSERFKAYFLFSKNNSKLKYKISINSNAGKYSLHYTFFYQT